MHSDNMVYPDEVDDKPFIFVSYSRKDEKLVQEVIKILKDNHFRFWYDMGLKSGSEWAEELGDKINKCEQFMVLMSKNATESKYVRKEVGMAIDTKREGNIICVHLEETRLTPGLHLLLDNIHALYKYAYKNEIEFEKAICKAASKETFINDYAIEGNKIGSARIKFEETYDIAGLIGKGGMGTVYLAKHTRTNAIVAVKYASIDDTYRGEVIKESFYNEKKILSSLMNANCPYVPQIIDWYEDENSIYIIQSYIFGEPLKKKENYSEEEVVKIAIKVLGILRYMHENNIIYRDVKPANLIQNNTEDIFVVDFGISRQFIDLDEMEDAVGTVGFAPPEQYYCYNGKVHTDFTSDIFALGKTMEYLLYPEMIKLKKNIAIRAYRPDVSAELEAIILKMTSYCQKDRYETVDKMIDVMTNYKKTTMFRRVILRILSDVNRRKNKKQLSNRKDDNFVNLNNQPFYETTTLLEETERQRVSYGSNTEILDSTDNK